MVRTLTALVLGLMLMVGIAAPVAAATVRVTVNQTPITDVQIAQRVKLLQLEGRGGGATKAATEELINETLMMQEAKRLGIAVTDAQVNDAILNVARNIKVSRDKLGQILNQAGVNIETLKDRMRAAIAWSQVTQAAVMPRVQISEAELERQAEGKVTAANSFDYILKEVIFVLPGGKGNASARTGQANSFRKQFQGCDSAVQLSTKFTDAAVIDVGRRHATQLPDAISSELAKLNVGGITKPRVVQGGVSMLAICAKEVAEDTTFIKGNLRQEAGNAAMKGEVDAYLKEIRAKARITYG